MLSDKEYQERTTRLFRKAQADVRSLSKDELDEAMLRFPILDDDEDVLLDNAQYVGVSPEEFERVAEALRAEDDRRFEEDEEW